MTSRFAIRRPARLVAIITAGLMGLMALGLAQPAHATADGTPDSAFNANFPARGFGTYDQIGSIAALADGSVLVAAGLSGHHLMRFTSSGVEDTSFSSNIGSTITYPVEAIAVSGNTVYVGGRVGGHGVVNKMDDAGHIDTTFGLVTMNFKVYGLTVASNGDLLVAEQYGYKGRIHFDGTHAPTKSEFGNGNDGPYNSYVVVANASGSFFGGDSNIYNNSPRLSKWDNSTPNALIHSWPGISQDVRDLALMSDGGLLVATDSGVTRINPDYSDDTTFNGAMSSAGTAYAQSVAVDGAGHIYVGTSLGAIKKFSSSGVADTVFASHLGATVGNNVSKIALTNDGSYLYATGSIPGRLMRISSSGVIDTVFQTGIGAVLNADPTAVAVASTGAVYVGGWFSGYLKQFSSGGVESSGFTANVGRSLPSGVASLAVRDDGSVLVGGGVFAYGDPSNSSGYLRHYRSDGTQDSGFAVSGSAIDNVVSAVAVSGNSVFAGGPFTGTLAKFSMTGVKDATFSTNAAAALSGLTGGAFVYSIVVLGDGSILVGMSPFSGGPAVIKLASDGTPDATFNAAAATALDQSSNPQVQAIVVDPATGSIYVSGYIFRDYNMIKLTSGGARDNSTDGSGHTFLDNTTPVITMSLYQYPTSMVMLSDGTVLAALYNYVFKINADGSIADPSSVATADAFTQNFGTIQGDVTALAVTSTGDIVVGGNFTSAPDSRLAKFYGSVPPATMSNSGGGSGGGSGGSGGGSGGSGSGSSSSGSTSSSGAASSVVVQAPAVLAPVLLGSAASLPSSGVAPGSSVFLVNGAPQPVTVVPDSPVRPTALLASGGGVSMRFAGLDPVGGSLGVSGQSALVLQRDNSVSVEGSGVAPNSDVPLYLFSTPRLLGTVHSDAAGRFKGVLQVPTDIELGQHTLQVNAVGTDGAVRSLSLGVVLQAPTAATQKVAKATVRFSSGSSYLSAKATTALAALAKKVGAKATAGLVLGYVQPYGRGSTSPVLALQRAKTIAKYLAAHGVKASLITRGDGSLPSGQNARKADITISYAS